MADNVNANIRVDIDTSQALANLQSLQSRISAFNQSVVQSNASAVSAQRSMISGLQAQVGASRQFTTSITNVENSVSRLQGAIDRNKLSMGQYFRYGVASSKNFGRVFRQENEAITRLATERVRRLQTQYVALGEAHNGMTRAMQVRPLEVFNADAAVAAQRAQIFNKLLRDGSTSLLNFGKNTQWAGRQLMVGFTVPLTIFGGIASKTFMELEEQAIAFRKVYGDIFTTDQEVEKNLQGVRELSLELTKYGIAARDTFELANVAAQSGARGEDLVAQTTEATRLAVLGQMEQQEAIRATITLQNAFQLSNAELSDSVNFLNIVENQSVLSLQDVAGAIPRVAPVIKSLGGDVRDLSVMLVAMREGGVSAAEGANALKTSLARLISPTSGATSMAKEFGISLNQIVEGNQGDILGAVMELAEAMEALDELSQQRLLSEIFGKRQYARVGALFNNITNEASQAQRVLDLTTMSTEQLAATAERELGQVEQSIATKFTSAVEKLQVAIAPIGEQFLKLATPLVEQVTRLFEKFNDLSPTVKNFITILVTGLGVVTPVVLMLVGLFANFAANAIKGIALMRNFFLRIKGGASSIDYLSGAELDAAAAAASLEGKTTSLTGAINVQRGAVDNLTAAYGRYISSANAAAANLPQGFRPPARRMATGGVVGGTGNKDTEPALLTPGEFVMNRQATQRFGPILDAMNRGNITQLARGSQLSHLTMPFSPSSQQYQSSISGYGLQSVVSQFGQNAVKVVSNLVADLTTSLNMSLVKGVDKQKFGTEYAKTQNKFAKAAALGSGGKFDVASKQNIEIMKRFDKELLERIQAVDEATINDEIVARETRKLADQYRKTSGAQKKFGDALHNASQQVGQVRVSLGTEAVRRGIESGQLTRSQTGTGVFLGGTEVGRVSRSSGKVRPASPRNPTRSYARKDYVARTMGQASAQEFSQSYSETIAKNDPTAKGLRTEAGRRSPNRQAVANARQDAAGYANTFAIQMNKDLAKRFAGIGGKGPSTPLVGGMPMAPAATQQQIAAQVNAGNNLAKQTNQAAKSMSRVRTSANGFGNALMRGSGKLSGATMALSSLTLGLSFMDNGVGEFAQKIMPATFALTGIQQVLPMLTRMIPLMLSPAGLLVGGLTALAGAVILMKKNLQNMFDKAVDAGIEAAGSMKKIAESADIFGKSIKSLAPEKLQIAPKKQSKVAEYFETEEGQERLEELITQRQELGRTNFAQDLGKQVALEATTKGLSGKEIEAYIAELSNQLGDKKLYVDLKGQLIELIDPQGNGENILKDGLIVDIKPELAGKFIRGEANFTQQMQKDVINSLAQVEEFLDPSAIQERAIKDATALGDEYEELGRKIAEARKEWEYLQDTNADFDKVEEAFDKMKKLEGQQKQVTPQMPIVANQELAGRIQGRETPAETQKAYEKAAEAAAKYGKSLFLNRQAMALYNDAVERGAISQKEYEKMAAGVATQFIRVKKFAFEALDQLEDLDNTTALKAFREAFSEQAFAGIDEELRTKVTDALKDVSDKAAVTLGVEYARGSITEQEIIDLANVIDRLPTDHTKQTKIIVAYGEGSLTTANLEVLANNLENISQFDGKQTDYLLNLGVLGEEKFAQAIAMMVAVDKMMAGTTTFIAGQVSGAESALSDLTNEANEAKALMDKLFGPGDDDEEKDRGEDEEDGEGGSKTETWLEGLVKDISANLKLFVGNIKKGIPSIVSELRALNIPEQLIDAIGAGPEGLKRSKELLNLSQKKRAELIKNYNKSVAGEAVQGIQSKLQMKQQKDLARIRLESRNVEKDVIEDILSDEQAIFTLLFGTKKQQRELINGYKELAEETDPLDDAIERAKNEQEKLLDSVDKQIDAQQKVVDGIEEEIEKINELNEADQRIIRDKEREQELLERQIEATERLNETDQRRIEELSRESEMRSRVSDEISRELDKMSETETKIRDAYQERIDALDQVASINDYIINQQKQQIDLSKAISQGDIYAAAAAAQAMTAATSSFSRDQVRSALEQGMEGEVEGLRTSGGLTREQAEQRVADIAEQNYQTSLKIRDIEDVIYQRNIDIIPLKDQIRGIDDSIRIIQDQIYDRETQIYNTTKQRLDPENEILSSLEDQREETLKKTADNIEALDLAKDLDDATISQGENANSLADAWYNVGQQIKAAREAAVLALDKLNLKRPSRAAFDSAKDYRKALKNWQNDRATVIAQRDADIAKAIEGGNNALDAALGVQGNYAGGLISGNGGRDSVMSRLTPGEFVVRKSMVNKYGKGMLSDINMGSFSMPQYAMRDMPQANSVINSENNVSNINAPVYNTYDMKFNIDGANANADEIAHKVMTKIRSIDSASIRGINGY